MAKKFSIYADVCHYYSMYYDCVVVRAYALVVRAGGVRQVSGSIAIRASRLMSKRVRLNCTQHSYSLAIYFIFASDRALLSVFLSYCLRGSIIRILLLANETHTEHVGVGPLMM